MSLLTYIRERGGTGTPNCEVLRQTANAAKCSHHTLYMIARGHKAPGPLLTRRIAEATGLSVHDLRPDVFGPPQ